MTIKPGAKVIKLLTDVIFEWSY